MGIQFRSTGFRCASLISSLLLATQIWAQSSSSPLQSEPNQAATSVYPIEEITVTGERTLLSMKNQIRRIEEDMYRSFNALNKSDELDIFCDNKTQTTSHITQHSCEPVFLSNLKKENAQHTLSQLRNAFTDDGLDIEQLESGLGLLESEKALKDQMRHKYEELNNEILRVAQENPEYMNALLQIAKLKVEYETARKSAFASD